MAGFMRFALVVCALVCGFCFWQSFIDKGGGISQSEAKPFFYLSAAATTMVGLVSMSLNAKEKKQKLAAQHAAYAAHQAQAHAYWQAQQQQGSQQAQQGPWGGPRA